MHTSLVALGTWLVIISFVPSARSQSIELKSPPTGASTLGGRSFGFIGHVETDLKGRAVIVGGASRQELFVLDADGKATTPSVVLPEIGARLGWPAAAAFDGPTSLVIIDSQSPQWARVKFAEGRWVLDTLSSSTGLSRVSSVCAINGARYVMANLASSPTNGLVHEVSAAGTVRRSFGTPFGEIENPAVGYGHLLCLTTPPLVIAASKLYPEIRAYTPLGKLQWTTPLPSFQPMGFRVEGRRVRFSYPPDSVWDQTVSVFSPAPDVIAVQVGRMRGPAGTSPYLRVNTLFLSLSDGAVLGSQRGLPIVMAATSDKLYAVAEKEAQDLQIYYYHFRRR